MKPLTKKEIELRVNEKLKSFPSTSLLTLKIFLSPSEDNGYSHELENDEPDYAELSADAIRKGQLVWDDDRQGYIDRNGQLFPKNSPEWIINHNLKKTAKEDYHMVYFSFTDSATFEYRVQSVLRSIFEDDEDVYNIEIKNE